MQKVSVLIMLFLFTFIISSLSPFSAYAYELLIGTGEVGSFLILPGKVFVIPLSGLIKRSVVGRSLQITILTI